MGLIRPYLKLRKTIARSLAADMDDSFYFAHKELDKLFFMMNVFNWNIVIYEIVF